MIPIQSIKFEVKNARGVIGNIRPFISMDKDIVVNTSYYKIQEGVYGFIADDCSTFELIPQFQRWLINRTRRSAIKISGHAPVDQPGVIKVKLQMESRVLVHLIWLIAVSVFIFMIMETHVLMPMIYLFLGLNFSRPLIHLIKDTRKCDKIITQFINRAEEKYKP